MMLIENGFGSWQARGIIAVEKDNFSGIAAFAD